MVAVTSPGEVEGGVVVPFEMTDVVVAPFVTESERTYGRLATPPVMFPQRPNVPSVAVPSRLVWFGISSEMAADRAGSARTATSADAARTGRRNRAVRRRRGSESRAEEPWTPRMEDLPSSTVRWAVGEHGRCVPSSRGTAGRLPP